MGKRYEVSDEQWEKIKDLLPGREGHVGVTAQDNRRFINGVLWILRSGAPWRDLPERWGVGRIYTGARFCSCDFIEEQP